MAEPSLARVPLSDSLLDGADPALLSLVGELRELEERPADAGDLLVLLASVPDGLAARTLAALGVDAGTLASAVETARAEGTQAAIYTLAAEIEVARRDKEAAIEAQEFARAAELRDRERTLNEQMGAGRHDQLLADTLARLGLD